MSARDDLTELIRATCWPNWKYPETPESLADAIFDAGWRWRRQPPLICGGGSSDHVLGEFARGGFIPGPGSTRAHWRGYTAKVGLRKPGTWTQAKLEVVAKWLREERSRRLDDGWVPFGWHVAYPDVQLEFDGGTEWQPVWERNRAWTTGGSESEVPKSTGWGEKTDREFLGWLAERLVNVYGESPNVDFVHRLRAIADRQVETTSDGLTFTEREADRNAELGRVDNSALEALADRMAAKREAATHLLDDCPCPRPCCHTTGPLHHPACQERP